MKLEFEYIEKLVDLVSNAQLTELSLEEGDKAIRIKKDRDSAVVNTVSHEVKTVSVPAVDNQVFPQEEVQEEIKQEPKITEILSPMVGTFYSAPSKGAKPFVEVGDVVSKGQVVCIIEAMKLMNEIESEISGKIVRILVEDGQPVEYGQVLMHVE